MMDGLRHYPCRVQRVIDGDTFEVVIDHGFGLASTRTVRIFGIQAPEIRTPEGKQSKEWAESWVGNPMGNWPMQLVTHSLRDKYGRQLGDLIKPTGANYSNSAINAGTVTSWDGRKK